VKDWREDYVDRFEKAADKAAIRAELERIAAEMGFDYFSYGIKLTLPTYEERIELLSNYRSEWQRTYLEQGYVNVDPTVRHALKTSLPLVWSADNRQEAGAFWEEAASFDLKSGWCMSTRDRQGISGMFTLARGGEVMTPAERDEKELRLIWLSNLVHASLASMMTGDAMMGSFQGITPREREVLRWASIGKTNIEISMILGVDDQTIKFHFKNIMQKLGAANRTDATVRALFLGLIG
jgi:DNA-binding CsgD family transcriptional regulator